MTPPTAGRKGRPSTVPGEILHRVLLHGPHKVGATAHETPGASSLRKYVRGTKGRNGVLIDATLLRNDENGNSSLGPGLGLALAFSVGGEHLCVGLVDAAGDAHHVEDAQPLRSQLTKGPDIVAERMRSVAAKTIARGLNDPSLTVVRADGERELRLIGATAAWPAQVDRDTRPTNQHLGAPWTRKTFREHLSEALDLPLDRCHAMNDANAGAFAAAFEQTTDSGVGAVLCVHMSAGIGLGTVHMPIPRPDRKPFITATLVAGRQGLAGEIGHCRIDEGVVDLLNARLDSDRKQGVVSTLGPLDPSRRCACNKPGHVQAVFGADALLTRLRKQPARGSQLAELVKLHRLADDGDPDTRYAFHDIGSGVGSPLTGVVFALDPTAIRVAGALANSHVCEGMRERFRRRDASRIPVELFDRPDDEGPPALRGAALGVLRAAVYRGFFENGKYTPGTDGRQLEDWTGWDAPQQGAQSGQMSHAPDASWTYTPFPADRRWLKDRNWKRTDDDSRT